jgi:hypothetical protein
MEGGREGVRQEIREVQILGIYSTKNINLLMKSRKIRWSL